MRLVEGRRLFTNPAHPELRRDNLKMYAKRKTMTMLFVARKERVEPEPYWHPALDIYQLPGGWLLKFDLAGVRADDVGVTAHGNRIELTGIRRDLTAHETCRPYSMEISYNRFHRSVELPGNLENHEISAEFRDGILLVRVLLEGERK